MTRYIQTRRTNLNNLIMSKKERTSKKSNASGGIGIEDPPEVTDIVIVSNPPPNPIDDERRASKKETTVKLSKEGKLLVTVENMEVNTGDYAFVVITNLKPKKVSREPKPDPIYGKNPIIANFITMISSDTAEFMTDTVSFKGKLIMSGKFRLNYDVIFNGQPTRSGGRSAEVIA